MCSRYLLVVALLATAATADAQLFGPRQIGRNARGEGVANPATAGTVSGDRRFVRGARAANNFVGADKTEAAAFVGNTTATNDGAVTSSVTGLREQPPIRVNRPLRASQTGLHLPKLSVAFLIPPRVPVPNSQAEPEADDGSLEPVSTALRTFVQQRGIQISYFPTERDAVLTGSVLTEHDRQIAGILASFEPGLETVTNNLQVGR